MSHRPPDAELNAVSLLGEAPLAEFTLRLRLPASAKAGALARVRLLVICDVVLRLMRERSLQTRYVCDEVTGLHERAEERALLGLVDHAESQSSDDASDDDPCLELIRKDGQASERQRIGVGPLQPRFADKDAAHALANGLDLQRLCREFEPDAVRYFNLNAAYRLPLTPEFALDARGHLTCPELDEAERRIEYLYRTRERLAAARGGSVRERSEVPEEIGSYADEVPTALAADLDSPRALTAMMELLKQVNDLAERAKSKKSAVGRNALDSATEAVALCQRLLGLGNADGPTVLSRIRDRRAARLGIDAAEISRQVIARVEARAQRDFARADALRQEIEHKGIELVDDPAGTHWRIP